MTDLEKYIHDYVYGFSGEMSRTEKIMQIRCEQRIYEEKLFQNSAKKIMSLNPDIEKPKILEIGSGTGGLSVALALLGANVVGIEPDLNGILASEERAKRYQNVDVKFQKGVAETLFFEDGSFDIIVSCAVLEHVKDVKRSVDEIFRVLKKGGITYCELPNNLYPREEHYKIFWPPLLPKRLGKVYAKIRGKNPDFLDHLNYFTPKKAFTFFLEAGFIEVHDLWQDNFLKKLENPDMVEDEKTKTIIKISKALMLEKILKFAVIGCGFYKAIYIVAKKPDKSDNNGIND